MADAPLGKVDFERYQRWFDRALGHERPLTVLDGRGTSLWGGTAADVELARLLARSGETDVRVRRLELGAGGAFFCKTLFTAAFEPLGWVVVAALGNGASALPLENDQLAEALEELAERMGEDAGRDRDLASIAEELAECYEELHLVYAMDQHVRVDLGTEPDLFQKMLKSTARHMDVDVVTYVEPAEGKCLYATSLSKEIHNLDLVLVEMRGDLFRFVQSSGETIVLNDTGDPRRSYIFTDMPYRVLACPMKSASSVTGLVVLLNHLHKPPFTNSDRRLGEVLANQLASVGKNMLLLRSMSNFTEQLAQAMIEAVEAKDPYTRGHSERVNHLSMEIGRALALPADELLDLYWGSLLHDVGKIGIPDAVLCKPARLSKDEYSFIMVHPERSYEILRHVDLLKNAVSGARHHQEMFNGKGYPHGLKGHRIPLHARIMAVADTYDSITSSRAYRAGRSHETAMEEIERVSGTQLDPDIVGVFKKVCSTEPEWLQRFGIRREKSVAA